MSQDRYPISPVYSSVTMPPFTIDTDGISDEQKKGAKFRFAYDGLIAQLSVPGFVEVLCAHEAAHKVYLAVAGVKDFKFFPARIRYDPETDDYLADLASVQGVGLPPPASRIDDLVFNTARALAAGGVIARKLMPDTDGGDQNDKDRFLAFCDELSLRANFPVDAERIWKLAQNYVALDLEKPEILLFIKEEGEKIRSSLSY